MSPLSTAQFRSTSQLLQKKFRRETGRAIVEGKRLVHEALSAVDAVEFGLMTHEFAGSGDGKTLCAVFRGKGLPVYTVSEKQIGKLSDTVTSPGVLAVIRIPRYEEGAILSAAGPGALLVALDGISDPGNIGTIVRTCAWFGVDGVFMNDRSVEIGNPKLLRATMGAIFSVPLLENMILPDLLDRLKKSGFRVVVTSPGGDTTALPPAGDKKTVLVFGSEARGVSAAVQERADVLLEIPGYGAAESLNVSVAAGITLHMVKSAPG